MHKKFSEADIVIKLGGGFCVHNRNTIESKLKMLLSDKQLLEKAGKASFNLIRIILGQVKIINGILFD